MADGDFKQSKCSFKGSDSCRMAQTSCPSKAGPGVVSS